MKRAAIITSLIIFGLLFISYSSFATEKDDEVRKSMWKNAGEKFNRVDIPAKWENESAVIIAQMRSFTYRKPPIIAQLEFKKEFHNRIKLIDKTAVEEYSEISFLTTSNNRTISVGFKLIKPDGREIVIDPSTAVIMERDGSSGQVSYKKIAIPSLEPGDILDYYIYEEHVIGLNSLMYYFDPVIYNLPQEYPVINQQVKFNIQRRCFVSLKSLNGAPQLKVEEDIENDEQIFYLDDNDREPVSNVRWLYPYRELPAIKFRAAYMSGKGQRLTKFLVGEPGEVKSNVSTKELADFVSYMLNSYQSDVRSIQKYVKRNLEKNATNFEKARAGYYFYRNTALSNAELQTVSSNRDLSYYMDNPLKFLDMFSTFLGYQDIPYDIIMVIPKEISAIDDLLLEHELQYLIRVRQGSDYLYFSYYDPHKIPGEIDAQLQGTDAYFVNGAGKFVNWNPQRMTTPLSSAKDNSIEKLLNVKFDESFKSADMQVKTKVSGFFKSPLQNGLLDYYDFEEEEYGKFEKESLSGSRKKKLLNLRDSYLESREKKRNEIIEEFSQLDYDFSISEASDFKVHSTGRYEEDPFLIYSFDFKSEDLISKVGPNYLLQAGKLIESQVKIEENELNREVGIYMSAPKSYVHEIRIEIPEGYEARGIEKFNMDIQTDMGGFVSHATVEGNTIIFKTEKTYSAIYGDIAKWPEMVKFLNAAYDFTELKILLKKKS